MKGPDFSGNAERQQRAHCRADLLAVGIPPASADRIVDLAFHAAERASDTLFDVLGTLGDPREQITALGVAISVAAHRFRVMQDALPEMAEKCGLKAKTVTVGGAR